MSEMKTQREADWFGSRLTLADPFGPAAAEPQRNVKACSVNSLR